jgi:hypothetical protein
MRTSFIPESVLGTLRKLVRRAVALSALLALTGLAAGAATVRGRLIHTGDGSPAAGLAVTVNHPQFGRSKPVFSGPNGMFYLNGIPTGDFDLEIWTSTTSHVTVRIHVVEPLTDTKVTKVP